MIIEFFAQNICFIWRNTRNNKNNINHTLDQLNYKTNYEILEIDLSKYSIDIYKDASSDNKYDGYIYAYIPPKFIKIINKDEL